MDNTYNVQTIDYHTNCTRCTQSEWDILMRNAKRANVAKINHLVKKHLPELYYTLALNFPNPYYYYKTPTHFILVHSAIEYFLRITY